MIEMCLTRDELRKALKQLDIAYENGFKDSVVVLSLITAGQYVDDFIAAYDSVILKAHPTNKHMNWGRCPDPEGWKLRDGKCESV